MLLHNNVWRSLYCFHHLVASLTEFKWPISVSLSLTLSHSSHSLIQTTIFDARPSITNTHILSLYPLSHFLPSVQSTFCFPLHSLFLSSHTKCLYFVSIQFLSLRFSLLLPIKLSITLFYETVLFTQLSLSFTYGQWDQN